MIQVPNFKTTEIIQYEDMYQQFINSNEFTIALANQIIINYELWFKNDTDWIQNLFQL